MTYQVVITREGDDWLADVPSVPGAHTFARSLTALVKAAGEVIVLMDDLDDDARPELELTFDVDDAAVTEAAKVGEERRGQAERERRLQDETLQAVRQLVDAGYSVRDASVLLGVTPGRVSQLTNA